MAVQSYTLEQIAKMTGYSRSTVCRIFEKEPGVLILERLEGMNKRRYRSIRVPEEVFERVRQRLALK